jgi:hypothetical protein
MFFRRITFFAAAAALLISGCSAFPGLRVLTGQQDAATAPEIAPLELVMADKAGTTDPALLLIGDRIEAANRFVDVIEIMENSATSMFDITMIYFPPQPAQTQQGARESFDLLRRTNEIVWQAVLSQSIDVDVLRITLLLPNEVNTLDNGAGFVGIIGPRFQIERIEAVDYLRGQRTLQSFSEMLAEGRLLYTPLDRTTFEVYRGTPNHPMFFLPDREDGG